MSLEQNDDLPSGADAVDDYYRTDLSRPNPVLALTTTYGAGLALILTFQACESDANISHPDLTQQIVNEVPPEGE